MGDYNSEKNRAVWMDIPVANLERAAAFYAAVLDIQIHTDEYEGTPFGILEHQDGNGGCLIVNEKAVSAEAGIMVYFNADGRIRDAVTNVTQFGGSVVEDTHPIGPHGFRAIVLDSEGNRIVLHSNSDA